MAEGRARIGSNSFRNTGRSGCTTARPVAASRAADQRPAFRRLRQLHVCHSAPRTGAAHRGRAPAAWRPRFQREKADWVIGSAFGAITLAYAVAERLGARAGFTEKDGEGMKLARFEIAPGEKVLVVEDTISTGGSTLKTIAALQQAGVAAGDILP